VSLQLFRRRCFETPFRVVVTCTVGDRLGFYEVRAPPFVAVSGLLRWLWRCGNVLPNLFVFLNQFLDFVAVVPGLLIRFAVVLVCLARKGFSACCVVAEAVGSWIGPCWRSFHSPCLTVANSHSSSFFATLVSSSCADLLGSVVVGVVCFWFWFYLLRLFLDHFCCSWIVCLFPFGLFTTWLHWVRPYVPPVSLYFVFLWSIYLGCCRSCHLHSFCLEKKTSNHMFYNLKYVT
jgi:hypothetical protein